MARATPPDRDIAEWPRLARFYGLSFSELRVMPRAFVTVYRDAYAGLVAEEQLRAIQAASFPNYEEDTQRELYDDLLEVAGISTQQVPKPLPSLFGPVRVVLEAPKAVTDDA